MNVLVLLLSAEVLVSSLGGEVRAWDETKAMLPGVTITLQRVGSTDRWQAHSDENGAYSIPGLALGEYDVRAELAGAIGVTIHICVGVTRHLDFDLQFERGECQCVTANNLDGTPYRPVLPSPSVSGVVRDEAGRAIRLATVEVLRDDAAPRRAVTSRRGRFKIETDTDEGVTLQFHAPSYYDQTLKVNGGSSRLQIVLHTECK